MRCGDGGGDGGGGAGEGGGLRGVVGAVDGVGAVLGALGFLVEGVCGADGALRCDGLRARAGVCWGLVLAVVGVVEAGGGGDAVCLGLGLAVGGQEDDADLLLLDGGLGRRLDAGPDLGHGLAVGRVGGDGDGLHEELVFAAHVQRRVLFHGLQEDLDLDGAGGLDTAGVGAHAVPGSGVLGGGGGG